VIEGFRAVLVEQWEPYLPLIVARLTKPIQIDLFGHADDAAPPPEWPRPDGAGSNPTTRPSRRHNPPATDPTPRQEEALW
jgi:hypothetical protein